jgi:hypothetical protein
MEAVMAKVAPGQVFLLYLFFPSIPSVLIPSSVHSIFVFCLQLKQQGTLYQPTIRIKEIASNDKMTMNGE